MRAMLLSPLIGYCYQMYDLSDLRKLRKQLGLTQLELARMSGVSQSFIAKIESGKVDPSYEKVKRIFSVLENLRAKSSLKALDVMEPNLITVREEASVLEAAEIMRKHAISQMPVTRDKKIIGSITEGGIVKKIVEDGGLDKVARMKVKDIIEECFPIVNTETPIEPIAKLLNYYPAVLVAERGRIVGIITKSDLLRVGKK